MERTLLGHGALGSGLELGNLAVDLSRGLCLRQVEAVGIVGVDLTEGSFVNNGSGLQGSSRAREAEGGRRARWSSEGRERRHGRRNALRGHELEGLCIRRSGEAANMLRLARLGGAGRS